MRTLASRTCGLLWGLLLALSACGGGGGTDGDGGGGGGGGGTFTPSFFAPVPVALGIASGPFAADSDGLFAVAAYADHTTDTIRVTRSVDGGRTWSPAVDLDPFVDYVSSDVAGMLLCCRGDYVYVAWSEVVEEAGLFPTHIFLASSRDAGVTWSIRQMDQADFATGEMDLCCDGRRATVVWAEGFHQPGTLRINSTADGGVSWSSPDGTIVSLSQFDRFGTNSLWCEGDRVVFAFVHVDPPPNMGPQDFSVQVRSSADGGSSFSGTTRLDSTGAGLGDPGTDVPLVAGSGAQVYVVWPLVDALGASSLRVNRSEDGGATWAASDDLVAANAETPADTAVGRGNAGLLAVTPTRCHVPRSHAGVVEDAIVWSGTIGAWAASPPLNRTPPGGTCSGGPLLAGRGGPLYAAWPDIDSAFNQQTRVVWSLDEGATWSPDVTVVPPAGISPIYNGFLLRGNGPHLYVFTRYGPDYFVTAAHP